MANRTISFTIVLLVFLVKTLLFSSTTAAGSVHLAWDPNREVNAAGYNVYRATLPAGPYTRINTSPIQVPFYVDHSAQQDSTYYYAVTAVDTDGIESGHSSNVKVVLAGYTGSAFAAGSVSDLAADSGEMVLLVGNVWNPENQHLTFSWTQILGPPVSIAGNTRPEASFLAPVVTDDILFSFVFSTVGPDGTTTSDIMQVTVRKK